MADIFSELASMPRSETMKPAEFRKGLLKVGDQVVSLFGFDYDVVDIGLNGSPDEVSEATEHTTLVCCPSILQTERHRNVAK